MFQINVDRLVKDELEYELKVRGINDTGNVEAMRKHFRSILALEKSSSPLHGKFNIDTGDEIRECDRKLLELKDCITSFTGSSSQGKKIETKFAHLTGRIGRIPETDAMLQKIGLGYYCLYLNLSQNIQTSQKFVVMHQHKLLLWIHHLEDHKYCLQHLLTKTLQCVRIALQL